MTEARGYPVIRLGVVDAENGSLDFQGQFSASIEDLHTANTETLSKYFG